MAHPEGFEPSTYGFEVRRSIQLSYGCKLFDAAGVKGAAPRWRSHFTGHPNSNLVAAGQKKSSDFSKSGVSDGT